MTHKKTYFYQMKTSQYEMNEFNALGTNGRIDCWIISIRTSPMVDNLDSVISPKLDPIATGSTIGKVYTDHNHV
ncbi:hypothetical protein CAEBREN_04385 [Caenorhabditis brenneri]|uniref:Uncharacterized protein n=1 Tax=Caenorhabditis brenneri TaxID=135651 RepID=G0NGE8_CAEBE|nr:hypothetical protein CAEBREN_04385 [Caenorhabditis brenneri]